MPISKINGISKSTLAERNSGSLATAKKINSVANDDDFFAYIAAVEAADTQALEAGVREAILRFFAGCREDGIWDAIKSSCILAGARTVAGAMVPLKGTAPTNNGPFVAGDYNRETGLKSDSYSKYINANRNNNADPQNSKHVSVYVTEWESTLNTYRTLMGGGTNQGAGHTLLGFPWNNTAQVNFYTNSAAVTPVDNVTLTDPCLMGFSRNSSTQYMRRYGGSSSTVTLNSAAPIDASTYIYRHPALSGGSTIYSRHRQAFYSIGEGIDLAKLESRVAKMLADFNTAIA